MGKEKYPKSLRLGVLCVVIVVVLINMFPIFTAFDIYEFSNRDGTFRFGEYPSQGTDLVMMEADWKQFKDTTHMDKVLYRTFEMHPLYFWMWGSYLFNKRYRYPYLNDELIDGNGN